MKNASSKKFKEFKKKFNLRKHEKCCATCEFGEIGYDGSMKCCHPEIVGEEYWLSMWQFAVCDAWKKAKGRRFRDTV